jgi:hypothetical protein
MSSSIIIFIKQTVRKHTAIIHQRIINRNDFWRPPSRTTSIRTITNPCRPAKNSGVWRWTRRCRKKKRTQPNNDRRHPSIEPAIRAERKKNRRSRRTATISANAPKKSEAERHHQLGHHRPWHVDFAQSGAWDRILLLRSEVTTHRLSTTSDSNEERIRKERLLIKTEIVVYINKHTSC